MANIDPSTARPDWADALLVRDKDGLLHLADAERGLFNCQNGAYWPVSDMRSLEPITVVIDADGNPPTPEPEPRLHSVDADVAWAHYRKTYAPNPDHMAAAHKAFHAGWDMATTELQWDNSPEPVWLDAGEIEKLPVGSVVLPKHQPTARAKQANGWWRQIDNLADENGQGSSLFAPARVLYNPEADR